MSECQFSFDYARTRWIKYSRKLVGLVPTAHLHPHTLNLTAADKVAISINHLLTFAFCPAEPRACLAAASGLLKGAGSRSATALAPAAATATATTTTSPRLRLTHYTYCFPCPATLSSAHPSTQTLFHLPNAIFTIRRHTRHWSRPRKWRRSSSSSLLSETLYQTSNHQSLPSPECFLYKQGSPITPLAPRPSHLPVQGSLPLSPL